MSALEGIKVIDFSWVGVGPATSRYLADHGATVIRVESRHSIDYIRMAPPFKDNIIHHDRSAYFANYNINKYGITLNLKNATGRKLALRLVQWADVLLESFSPGSMKKLGLDYDTISELKPDIIYASTSQLGQNGPYASFRGLGSQGAALSGFGDITGYPNDEPLGPFVAYTDFIAHRYLIIAIIMALLHRSKTGLGQFIDQSQVESSIHFLAPALLDYMLNGNIFSTPGNLELSAAPHNAYPCKGNDAWCVIAVYTDKEWHNFCEATENTSLVCDPQFSTILARKEHEGELDAVVTRWTLKHTPREVMKILQDKGVAAGIVSKASDLYEDPQLKFRNHFWQVNHPVIGPHHCDATACRLSDTPAQPKMPAPCLGQHNSYVYKDILGLSDSEYVDYRNSGIFE